MRLAVGSPAEDGKRPWRVAIVDSRYPSVSSNAPKFTESDVEYVYLLCGGGHFFPDDSPNALLGRRRRQRSRQRIDVWNMTAAIGAPASGKTYLVLRTLHQSLQDEIFTFEDNTIRLEQRQLTQLEAVPLRSRAELYTLTLTQSLPIAPTLTQTATPAEIIRRELPLAYPAIQALVQRTVRYGAQRAAGWGSAVRQPLVVRADVGGRRTWTGVADLPGEMFDSSHQQPSEAGLLRDYDSLLWVVDPAVPGKPSTTTWLGLDNAEVLDGSIRPGDSQAEGPAKVRADRDQIQRDIGRQLSLVDGYYAADQGDGLELLVAISKCDLIADALEKPESTLAGLGDDGEVYRGVQTYLLYLAARWVRSGMKCDDICALLLSYIHAGRAAEERVRQQRAGDIARELLQHFSTASLFWQLVHGGEADQVNVPGHGMDARPFRIVLPSLGEHLSQANRRGSAYRLLIRDLVMSAVGCGIAYGLGLRSSLFAALRREHQHTRFFLCSPLATVPISENNKNLKPRDLKASFPTVDQRSAGLTQLLLAMLEKVRGTEA
jgi:hypothetical protein